MSQLGECEISCSSDDSGMANLHGSGGRVTIAHYFATMPHISSYISPTASIYPVFLRPLLSSESTFNYHDILFIDTMYHDFWYTYLCYDHQNYV